MHYLSIVIPVYNEDQNIEKLIFEVHEVLESIRDSIQSEIIVIDDASTDNTKSILNKLNQMKLITFYSNDKNSGQSFSIYKGVSKSKHTTIITLDGDLQNDPNDLNNLLPIYFNDTNLKLLGGIRKKRKDSTTKKISSFLANYIRMIILNDNCKDTGCGLKIFDRDIFLLFPFFDGMHRFLPALFKGYGHKTHFINVNHRTRYKGYSKYGIRNRLFVGIRDMIKVRKILKNIK